MPPKNSVQVSKRMSGYCADCAYDPKIKLGTGACPFNFL